jgi:hypothetical protein
LANKLFGVFSDGSNHNVTALFTDVVGSAVVGVSARVQSSTRNTVVVVIPSEESVAVVTSALETAKSAGEVGSVLDRSKLRLRVGVVADVGTVVGLVAPRLPSKCGTG